MLYSGSLVELCAGRSGGVTKDWASFPLILGILQTLSFIEAFGPPAIYV